MVQLSQWTNWFYVKLHIFITVPVDVWRIRSVWPRKSTSAFGPSIWRCDHWTHFQLESHGSRCLSNAWSEGGFRCHVRGRVPLGSLFVTREEPTGSWQSSNDVYEGWGRILGWWWVDPKGWRWHWHVVIHKDTQGVFKMCPTCRVVCISKYALWISRCTHIIVWSCMITCG